MPPEEQILLDEIIQTSAKLRRNLDRLYKLHDHDGDMGGGVLISSLRSLTIALEDGAIAMALHLSEKGK
jgi:hypothetical protein